MVGMHQYVDFPFSPSKSYSFPKRKKKGLCLGINYSCSVSSKPLIPTAGSFSWEINCIERKRSSSLVSFLLLWTKLDLIYISFSPTHIITYSFIFFEKVSIIIVIMFHKQGLFGHFLLKGRRTLFFLLLSYLPTITHLP